MTTTVTVIIPTICEILRESQLLRAIETAQAQRGVVAKILVIVNGVRYDPSLLARLQSRSDIEVEYREVGSLPLALEYGRSRVKSDFFCFLDDDDELTEDSISMRLDALDDVTIDVAVSNGFNAHNGQRHLRVKQPSKVQDDPLSALVQENWLASSGGLFRTRSIPMEYFSNLLKYYEWTTLAFRISLNKKIAFIDQPGYVINDTPSSLSKNAEFLLSDEKIIREMLSYPVPFSVQILLKRKLAQALHNNSSYFFERGDLFSAWRYHVSSMFSRGGGRFVLYTRKLLLPWLYRS
jgi:glycosyltransferase involved in cell wall biosynthesis